MSAGGDMQGFWAWGTAGARKHPSRPIGHSAAEPHSVHAVPAVVVPPTCSPGGQTCQFYTPGCRDDGLYPPSPLRGSGPLRSPGLPDARRAPHPRRRGLPGLEARPQRRFPAGRACKGPADRPCGLPGESSVLRTRISPPPPLRRPALMWAVLWDVRSPFSRGVWGRARVQISTPPRAQAQAGRRGAISRPLLPCRMLLLLQISALCLPCPRVSQALSAGSPAFATETAAPVAPVRQPAELQAEVEKRNTEALTK